MIESRNDKLLDATWFAFWLGLSSFWILTAAATLGATFDEPIDLFRAMDFWRHGSHHELLRVGAMPLPMDVASLPAYLYERFHGTTIDWNKDYPTEALFYCRAIMLVFWVMLLWFARVVGRELGGPWAGRLAVALLACEPNFLAHACLATKDIAACAFLLPTIYYFGKNRDGSWWKRILVPALWFGGALLAKASALMFVSVGMLIVEVVRLSRAGAFNGTTTTGSVVRRLWSRFVTPLRPFVRDGIQIGMLALAVIFVYCGSDWKTEPSWIRWAHTLPDGAFKTSMVYLSEHLAIFNNAGVGLVKQIGHNIRGHGAYVLGNSDPRALWYYFPVAISIKMTLPILLLPIVLLAIARRSLANWAWAAFAAALFVYSIQCRVQIGVRLMLPWIAVGIVGLSAATVRAWESSPVLWRRQLLLTTCCLGLVWNTYASFSIWPHGLCYVNELWGGSENGYRVISDSNYDWGQGVPELERWLASNGHPPVDVWYFGTDPAVAKLSATRKHFNATNVDAFLKEVDGHYLAVGTTVLYGSYVPPQTEVNQLLHRMRPIGRTKTFIIYDFSQPAPLAAR